MHIDVGAALLGLNDSDSSVLGEFCCFDLTPRMRRLDVSYVCVQFEGLLNDELSLVYPNYWMSVGSLHR